MAWHLGASTLLQPGIDQPPTALQIPLVCCQTCWPLLPANSACFEDAKVTFPGYPYVITALLTVRWKLGSTS